MDDRSTNRFISFLNHLKVNSSLRNSPDTISITGFTECCTNHTKPILLGNLPSNSFEYGAPSINNLLLDPNLEKNSPIPDLFCPHLYSLMNSAHLHQSSVYLTSTSSWFVILYFFAEILPTFGEPGSTN